MQSGGSGAGAGEYPPQSTSPLQLTPTLDDVQIGKIRDTAASIVKTLPPTVESKTPTNKKKISKELEVREGHGIVAANATDSSLQSFLRDIWRIVSHIISSFVRLIDIKLKSVCLTVLLPVRDLYAER